MENIKYFSNVKSQDVKFNAFFHYLKSFSQTAVDTLYKLQSQFNKEMFKDKKDSQKLCTIKNLLQAYEIFTLQVKDSCDFIQISQFGFCIGKTFMQLMKIIKWVLKEWINNKPGDKMAKALQKADRLDSDKTERPQLSNVCSFCEQIIKTSPSGKQTKNKRKGIAGGVGNDFRQAKKIHINETNHLIEYKNQVIDRFVKIAQIIDNEIDREQKMYLRQLIALSINYIRQILNRKQQTLKLQISNGENVLQQILNEFNAKNQSIARFVINSQASFIEDAKTNYDTDFDVFQQKMRELIKLKFKEANQKIKMLTKARLQEYEKERKRRQMSRQTQTAVIQSNQADKFEYKLKKMNGQMQKLKNELNAQRDLTESLKQLLQSKSIEFQEEFLSYRKDLIMQNKDKIYLKSLKSFKDIVSKNGDQKTQDNRISIRYDNGSKVISNSKISNLANRDKNRDNNRKKLKNEIKFTFDDGGFQQNEDKISRQGTSNNLAMVAQDKKIHSHTWNEADNWIQKYSKPDIQANIIDSESCISENLKEHIHASTQTDSFSFTMTTQKPEKTLGQFTKSSLTKNAENKQQRKYINIYSNVKSRVYDIVPRTKGPIARQTMKEVQNKQSSTDNLFVKRLIQIQNAPEIQLQEIQCYRIKQEPIFMPIKKIMLSRKDIVGLFINQLNAKNYQCLLYRNQMFNLTNINPKRIINNTNKLQARHMNSCSSTPKKDMFFNETLQSKIVKAFYYQMSYIKKREKLLYELLKLIFRSPYQIMKKLQYTQLQGNNENFIEDALQYSQLNKMVNLLLKFHQGCIRNKKDVICFHLAIFCEKIGIRLCE